MNKHGDRPDESESRVTFKLMAEKMITTIGSRPSIIFHGKPQRLRSAARLRGYVGPTSAVYYHY